MKVPLFDLNRLISEKKEELISSFKKMLDDSNFILGEEVYEFESKFSNLMKRKHCISMSNGTDSLQAIFMASGLEPGSDILVPSFTFIASASSILRAGYNPVFVDVKKNSFHPSLDEIKDAVTAKTSALLFVHLFGERIDLKEIKSFCDKKNIKIFEDCAQSFGTKESSLSIASSYSFFPAKNMGCLGDGGAVLTDDDDLHKKLLMVRAHGSKIKYQYEIVGGNFRMDTIQAGFLNILLNNSEKWIDKRIDNAKFYNEKFKNIEEIIIPKIHENHSFNQYTIILKNRDCLRKFLNKNKIGNSVYYPYPLHSNKIFNSNKNLSNTDDICKSVISIPVYPGLKENERDLVASKILEFFNDS